MKMFRRGLTLAELAFVLFIMAVMLILFLPKFGESVDKTRATGVKSDLRVYQMAIETALRETNGEVDGGSLDTYTIERNMDKSYVFNEDTGLALKKDPWKNPYKIEFYDATTGFETDANANGGGTGVIVGSGIPAASEGTKLNDAIVVVRSAGKDGKFAESINSASGTYSDDDLILAVYYKNGDIDSCDYGFKNGTRYLEVMEYSGVATNQFCGGPVL